jgi:peptidoglycan/LPS O-acetylase OafA/YrhL
MARRRETILEAFDPRSNSLNLLRLVMATAVILSHSIVLGGFGSESILGKTTLGTVAVYGFFGISGYLIAGSADRNRFGRYLWQRFLRIFPAFWVCLIVTAFVFGTIAYFHNNPVLSNRCGLHCYLSVPGGPFGYVFHNFWLQMNQGGIALTLEHDFGLGGWNASLWTLELEFLCYLIVGLVAVVGLLKRRWSVVALAGVVWIAEIVIISVPALSRNFSPYARWDFFRLTGSGGLTFEWINLLSLLGVFLAGSLIYLYRDRIPDSGVLAAGSLALFLAGMFIPVGLSIGPSVWLVHLTSLNLTAVFLAYPLIWLGIHLPFTRVGATNDYSYGVYIYAAPVQQLMTMWGVNHWGYVPYTALTILMVAPLAVASWWLVEKQSLKLKKAQLGRLLKLPPKPTPRAEVSAASVGSDDEGR